jgi:AAA domain-containing protein
MILGGHSKSNKSFVALNMALDLSKGRNLFGAVYRNGTPVFPVTQSWNVLMIEQEIGEDGLRNRMMGMLGGNLDKAVCPFWVRSKDMQLQLDTPAGMALIEQEVAEHRPDVLILDPLSKMHTSDEKDPTEMGKVMRACDVFVQKYGCSVIIVHHFGLASLDKDNPRRGGNKLRGASSLFADVDSFCEIMRKSSTTSEEPVLQLTWELRQGAPILPVQVKRTKSGRVDYIGEVDPTP